MPSCPLRVLLTSEDRPLLRRLARFLRAFGFEPAAAAGADALRAAFAARRPDVVLLDGRLPREQWREVCGLAAEAPGRTRACVCLLVERPLTGDLVDALEAGVDDFLARTPVYGELLARLRAAARVLELERRTADQNFRDPLTGLPGRARAAELERRLRKNGAAVAAAVLEADFLRRCAAPEQPHAWADALRALAEWLAARLGPEQALAALGEERFVVVWSGADEDAAAAWAEELRAAAEAQPPLADPEGVGVTWSCGVAACGPGEEGPADVVDAALEALELARLSGRNCVVRHAECAGDTQAWEELAAPGRLFEQTTARDLMTPCTLVLAEDCPAGQAEAELAARGAPAAPVVDGLGALLGLYAPPQGRSQSTSRRTAPLKSLGLPRPPAVEEDAKFEELAEVFSRDPQATVVVLRDGRPTGLATLRSITLLSDPTGWSFPAGPCGGFPGDVAAVLDPALAAGE